MIAVIISAIVSILVSFGVSDFICAKYFTFFDCLEDEKFEEMRRITLDAIDRHMVARKEGE